MSNGVWHKHPYYPSELAVELCVVSEYEATMGGPDVQVSCMRLEEAGSEGGGCCRRVSVRSAGLKLEGGRRHEAGLRMIWDVTR